MICCDDEDDQKTIEFSYDNDNDSDDCGDIDDIDDDNDDNDNDDDNDADNDDNDDLKPCMRAACILLTGSTSANSPVQSFGSEEYDYDGDDSDDDDNDHDEEYDDADDNDDDYDDDGDEENIEIRIQAKNHLLVSLIVMKSLVMATMMVKIPTYSKICQQRQLTHRGIQSNPT